MHSTKLHFTDLTQNNILCILLLFYYFFCKGWWGGTLISGWWGGPVPLVFGWQSSLKRDILTPSGLSWLCSYVGVIVSAAPPAPCMHGNKSKMMIRTHTNAWKSHFYVQWPIPNKVLKLVEKVVRFWPDHPKRFRRPCLIVPLDAKIFLDWGKHITFLSQVLTCFSFFAELPPLLQRLLMYEERILKASCVLHCMGILLVTWHS